MKKLFVEQSISLDQLEANLLDADKCISDGDRLSFRANFFIPVMLEWFPQEGPLEQWPVKMMDWIEEMVVKHPILNKRHVTFDSMYVVKVIVDSPRPSVNTLARRIQAGRKMVARKYQPYVKVIGDQRVVTITPDVISIKSAGDVVELEVWKRCIQTDGSYEWLQFFHRQAKYIDDAIPFCPPTVQEARNRAHGLIGRLTGIPSVYDFWPKYFGNHVAVQEIAHEPAKVEQAQMIADIIEYFKVQHTEEEIADFIETIKTREIECGVSKVWPVAAE